MTEIAVPETPRRDHLYTIYAATRSGGLWKTSNNGITWDPISDSVEVAAVGAVAINVVVQDRRNAALLIVGNDLGVWVSIDAWARWSRLRGNLPTVPVDDLTVHPREHDVVIGTYGRGIWIGDIRPLQEARPAMFAPGGAAAHAFDIEPRARYGFGAIGNYNLYGNKYIEVPNEPDALVIQYWLRETSTSPAALTVSDASGKVLSELTGPADAGLNRVLWHMRPGAPQTGRGGGGGGGGGGAGGGGGNVGRDGAVPPVLPGDYQVRIDVAGQSFTKTGTIRARIGG